MSRLLEVSLSSAAAHSTPRPFTPPPAAAAFDLHTPEHHLCHTRPRPWTLGLLNRPALCGPPALGRQQHKLELAYHCEAQAVCLSPRLAPAHLRVLASLNSCGEGCLDILLALATRLQFPPSLFQAAASLPANVAWAGTLYSQHVEKCCCCAVSPNLDVQLNRCVKNL